MGLRTDQVKINEQDSDRREGFRVSTLSFSKLSRRLNQWGFRVVSDIRILNMSERISEAECELST